ncbi:MAG: TRAP transporter small permease [Alphaproteobacteria bacterium]
MRRALDLLYRGSGILAAILLAAIGLVVLLQVGANLIDEIASWITGEPIGLVVPSYAEFAGFFLAASSFLALAYTLRAGGHIRVSLVIQNVVGTGRRLVELWCLAAAASLSGYFSFFTIGLVLDSYAFGDLSFGMVPVPLWIPQTLVALGLVIFTIALIDEFFQVLRGEQPSYEGTEAAEGATAGDEPESAPARDADVSAGE